MQCHAMPCKQFTLLKCRILWCASFQYGQWWRNTAMRHIDTFATVSGWGPLKASTTTEKGAASSTMRYATQSLQCCAHSSTYPNHQIPSYWSNSTSTKVWTPWLHSTGSLLLHMLTVLCQHGSDTAFPAKMVEIQFEWGQGNTACVYLCMYVWTTQPRAYRYWQLEAQL